MITPSNKGTVGPGRGLNGGHAGLRAYHTPVSLLWAIRDRRDMDKMPAKGRARVQSTGLLHGELLHVILSVKTIVITDLLSQNHVQLLIIKT